MNTKDFRIAFCTDFSETSNKRLNTFLFNIWSFNVSVDIIHIIENEEESFREIEELKAGLSLQESHFGSFNFVIFNKNEKEELLAHLNSGIYASVNIGLIGNRPKTVSGYFVKMIYTQLLEDLVIVPPMNSERIHNRITVFLDKENVDYLYLIRRYSSFLRFNYSKLNIIMKCSKDAEKITDLAFDNKLKEILPGLNFDITLVKEEDSKRVLLGLLEEKKQDFYVLFSEDFFFDFSMNFFTESIDYFSFDAPLLKFAVTPEKIEQYKTDSENRVIFELRDI